MLRGSEPLVQINSSVLSVVQLNSSLSVQTFDQQGHVTRLAETAEGREERSVKLETLAETAEEKGGALGETRHSGLTCSQACCKKSGV